MDAQTLLSNTQTRLKRHEGQYAAIAERYPGFSYSWLTKLAQGQMKDPKVSTLQKLIEALDDFEGVPRPVRIDTPEAVAALLGVSPRAAEPDVAEPDSALANASGAAPLPAEPDVAGPHDPDSDRIAPAEETA